ncbi:hypothetical protein [Nannocystis punicea]|uniref:Uncharacterized protein n=1 Tax=Nannocystis punicea TaxID=2995304 RepID=A0ABY7H6X7_9BACT|nr:hypothetical protein [Nannocystis poenicansa]WAS95018.1 hypothetical protein O0S08_02555 [Nannocystis poenicansa]
MSAETCHLVLVAPAYVSARRVDPRESIAAFFDALATTEIELWCGLPPGPWYERVVPLAPGELLARTGELAPGTALVELAASLQLDVEELFASGWGPQVSARLAAVTVTSHVTAATPQLPATRPPELRREARICFPLGEGTIRSHELHALLRDDVPWEPLGLIDDAIPHRRWRADDPRSLAAYELLLRLLDLLAGGKACLRVTEQIPPYDVHEVGATLQVDSSYSTCHDWRLERDGQTRPLVEVLSQLLDAGDHEAVGPGREWILAGIEDRPFLWAELVEQIEQFVATRVGAPPGLFARLRRAPRKA